MKRQAIGFAVWALVLTAGWIAVGQDAAKTGGQAAGSTGYQPKFAGDPARSEAEAGALGYMRTVIRSQRQYKKKYDKYAPSLLQLVHSGSFTRRMAQTDRGEYQVGFHARKDGYELTLTPKQLDAQHRSFYASEEGVIHADEEKAADEGSPKVQ